MKDKLIVSWIGHSCFLIEHQGIRILFDPFKPGSVPGLKFDNAFGVNKVFISHNHDDHNNGLIPVFLNFVDIKYETINVPHDNQKGKLRGMNLIHVVHLGDYKIVHFGDIGCQLDYQQIRQLKGADLILVPINGFYTIGASDAYELYKQISPKVMIPMHYYYDYKGYPDDNQLSKLIALDKNIIKLKEKSIDLSEYIDGQSKIIILDYQH